jgi:RNA polymerase sigma factor (sigma-70 family)
VTVEGVGDAVAESFAEFFHEHYAAVQGYVRRAFGRFDLDEVVAATFAVAWNRFAEMDEPPTAAWLFGVARNVVRNTARSQRRGQALYERLASETVSSARPRDEHEVVEWVDAVRRAWPRLDVDDRELLALVVWHDLSSPEIALVLECSPGAARVRLSRARRRLRELVGPSDADGSPEGAQ